jgi:hypothetical protein
VGGSQNNRHTRTSYAYRNWRPLGSEEHSRFREALSPKHRAASNPRRAVERSFWCIAWLN